MSAGAYGLPYVAQNGQSCHFDRPPLTSGLPRFGHVSKVPISDIDHGWRLSQRGS